MRVLATHIKHAMARKIEWAVLPALLYLAPRVGHRAPAPASPSCPGRAPLYTSRFWTSARPREPWPLRVPAPCPRANSPSRRGSRAPRDWGLREERVGESVCRLPSCPMLGFAFASPQREPFFPPAARLPGHHHLPYTESTFHAISPKWRGRDPSRSGGWIMDHSRTRGRGG
jgi:hypothetical protein